MDIKKEIKDILAEWGRQSTLKCERPVKGSLASMIDHTLLKPKATEKDILRICDEAVQFGFATVCVQPYWVAVASDALRASDVGVTTVIGFPHGTQNSLSKAFEAKVAVLDGADEVDMVLNIGALKSKDYNSVLEDMKAVVDAVGEQAIIKVILETGVLTDEEKRIACECAVEANVDFVKTSTGFGPGHATVEDILLMKSVVEDRIQIKASGGIRDKETAFSMIRAGASRLGTSSGVSLVRDKEKDTDIHWSSY